MIQQQISNDGLLTRHEKRLVACKTKGRTHQKTISKIDLRDTKSRWGSCSSDKRIMLSWRVIMAPLEILDYVLRMRLLTLNIWIIPQNFGIYAMTHKW